MNKHIWLASTVFTLVSCTWVGEHKGASTIRIVSSDEASQCQRRGAINVQVKHKIAFVERGSKKVLKELQTLARNEAAAIKGVDTISPESEHQQGKQTYIAYQCI